MKGIIARKVGMSRVICPETGVVTPVTVLEAPEAVVLQVKTQDKDGYNAMVVAAFKRNKTLKNTNKNYRVIKEIALEDDQSIKKGTPITVADLEGVATVRVTGTSRGRGFSGVVRRHNFSRGPESHGSHHHREPGSIGCRAKPGRIQKGKKLPGRYGADRVTLRGVKVVRIDKENNLIALKGPVPGAKNSLIFIREDQ